MQVFQDTPAPAAPPSARLVASLELVVAVAANGIIGDRNRLPWHLPTDLRRFKALTIGHAMVMGRKTWEAIGRPLPERQSLVITRQPNFAARGAECAGSLDEAIALVRRPGPVFCIGGEQIFREALPRATRMHVTEIAADFAGDARFPPFDRSAWREVAREAHPAGIDAPFAFAFVTCERIT